MLIYICNAGNDVGFYILGMRRRVGCVDHVYVCVDRTFKDMHGVVAALCFVCRISPASLILLPPSHSFARFVPCYLYHVFPCPSPLLVPQSASQAPSIFFTVVLFLAASNRSSRMTPKTTLKVTVAVL